MQLELATPALLFSTISLLMLAYTNRFFGLSTVIRQLHEKYLADKNPVYVGQISNLRLRVRLIRDMQFLGVLSLLLCVVCMCVIWVGWSMFASAIFTASLVLLSISLTLSLIEIWISTRAIDIHLKEMER